MNEVIYECNIYTRTLTMHCCFHGYSASIYLNKSKNLTKAYFHAVTRSCHVLNATTKYIHHYLLDYDHKFHSQYLLHPKIKPRFSFVCWSYCKKCIKLAKQMDTKLKEKVENMNLWNMGTRKTFVSFYFPLNFKACLVNIRFIVSNFQSLTKFYHPKLKQHTFFWHY